MMKQSLTTFVLLVLCFGCATTQPDGLVRDYLPSATLSEPEEKQVLALARRCGLEDVERIRTFLCHPDYSCQIEVKEVEKVNGRRVTYRILEVRRRSCLGPDSPLPTNVIQNGDFWTHGPHKLDLTIVRVAGVSRRVSIQGGIAPDEAEWIFSCFVRGDVTYGESTNKQSLARADLRRPDGLSFSRDEGRYYIGCRATDDELVHFCISFRIQDGRIWILDIAAAIT